MQIDFERTTQDDEGCGELGEDKQVKDSSATGTKKGALLLADVMDAEATTKLDSVEPCAICLNDYQVDDILCWSQSQRCKHIFHRDCMEEWLLRQNECPCCRGNYLSLGDDDEDTEPNRGMGRNLNGRTPDDAAAFLRGMNLFYLLSRLQTLAESQGPNTTIRLEGLELADGRRGSLEIQGGGMPIHAITTINPVNNQGGGGGGGVRPSWGSSLRFWNTNANENALEPVRLERSHPQISTLSNDDSSLIHLAGITPRNHDASTTPPPVPDDADGETTGSHSVVDRR